MGVVAVDICQRHIKVSPNTHSVFVHVWVCGCVGGVGATNHSKPYLYNFTGR